MIKGIIFDYGGTIDTDSIHWSEVIWQGYKEIGIRISKEVFRMAYVHGERSLAKFPLIKPEHNFLDLLKIKMDIQTSFLADAHLWTEMDKSESHRKELSDHVAHYCYNFVLQNLRVSRKVLQNLAKKYPLVLVSNFYGNINTILKDFKLELFRQVIESAVVGVRKPDPRIFSLGVEALGLQPEEVIVVGDSYGKDIVPAHSIGCKTIWIKGIGWDDKEETDKSVPDSVISTIADLEDAVKQIVIM